ncbi:MAG: hypothetical protein DMG61_08790 [Acidobacteria bacterium]|nr:MAG: hypothetical protein DMG61_08790 [Acidobacteriota bacterium]PYY15554.1 MAG: hypothetical protein DMG60_17350 [Acidobacteriota bacterium]
MVPKSSPASSRTAELPFSSEIKSSRPANNAGLEYKMRQPGVSLRASFNRAAKGAALLSDDALLAGGNLDRPAACCKTVQISWRVSWFPQVLKGHSFSEA